MITTDLVPPTEGLRLVKQSMNEGVLGVLWKVAESLYALK
jgi:hypothetical protein